MKDIFERMREYHASHDCKPDKCACACGCDVQLGCTASGPLCSVCTVRAMRDEGKGLPEAAAVDQASERLRDYLDEAKEAEGDE